MEIIPISFSLPYSLAFLQAKDFPAFNRYYGDAKTAFALLLSFGCPSVRIPLRCYLFFAHSQVVTFTCNAWTAFSATCPCDRHSCGGGRLSRVSMQTSLPLILSQTPVESAVFVISTLPMLHQLHEQSMLQHLQLSKLNPIPSAVAVYASCRHC